MPRYLLKGLLITFLILVVLTGIGVGTGVLVSAKLNNTVVNARQNGFEQGYFKGRSDGFQLGSEAGYQAGSKKGYIDAGGPNANTVTQPGYYFVYNPSYDEVMTTLGQNELYTAQAILDYAKSNGIRAAYVRVPIARPASEGRIYLYQLVSFDTVDKGMIIVEPRSHREVKVEVGKSYSQLNGFPISDYDDTITKVTTVW